MNVSPSEARSQERGAMGRRAPYAPPQTSMERHLLEIIEHVRNGSDTRAGFAQKVELAQSHAFWLENLCREQQQEIERLLDYCAPRMPDIQCSADQIENHYFDWRMEALGYRVQLRPMERPDDAMLKRIKRHAYRDLLKLFRASFEKTWTFNINRGSFRR